MVGLGSCRGLDRSDHGWFRSLERLDRAAVVDHGLADRIGLRRVELARDDDAFARRPTWMARRERQRRHGRVGRRDHLVVLGRHDLLAGHDVDEAAGRCGRDDLVARLQLLDAVERLTVGGAMARDRGVAQLAGQRGLRVVARALLEIALLHAGDDDPVDVDTGDLEAGHRVALAECRNVLLGRRHGGRPTTGATSAAPRPERCRREPVSSVERSGSFPRAVRRIRSRASSGPERSRCPYPRADRRRTRTSATRWR